MTGAYRPARGWVARNLAPILLAFLAILLAGVTTEMLIGRLRVQEERESLARAEIGAGVVQQLVLRRIEAADVLHRLGQSWFTLSENANWEGVAALEEHLAATANAGSFGFIQVALVGADGWIEWSSITGRRSRVYAGDREHFRIHAEGQRELFVSEPVLGRLSNRWSIQLTRPLLDREGRFGGIVVVSMDVHNLAQAFAENNPGRDGHALLLRGAGHVVAHSDALAGGPGDRLPPGDALVLRAARATSGAVIREDADGHPTAAGWHVVPGAGLTAAYVLRNEEPAADSPIAASIRLAGLALALLAVASAMIRILAGERRAAREAAERAERERQAAELARRTFETRIAGLPAVVFGGTLQPDGRFLLGHVSESLARVTGWPPAAVTSGEDWRRLAEDVDEAGHAAFGAAVLAEGHGVREYRLRRPEGPAIWVREHLRVVARRPDGTAEVVGYLGDIARERDMQVKAQMASRLATLGEMATGLAHELNQPLAVMSLAADNGIRALSRRGEQAIPDVIARLERIAAQSTRARDIVDHLRLFGHRGEMAEAEAIHLAEVVRGALILTGAALRAAGIRVETDLPADLPPVIGAVVPLEQAVVNLLLNARDAIEGAGPKEGRIGIAAQRRGDRVTLAVSDNGGGVPDAVLQRLFEPFFTTKPQGKGTGLGLSICHAAMRSFGGDIAVRNEAEGARFTLVFRVAPEVQPLPGQTAGLTAAAHSAP